MLSFYLSLIEDARDRFAFEDIYRSIEKDVVNYVNSLVHNKNDAEDIAQEAWLCVSKNIESFRANHYKSVKNYVFMIARYRMLDYISSEKQFPEFFEDMDVFSSPDYDNEGVFLELCANMEREEIIECIFSLPEIYKDVLNLHFLNGNNSRKIADMLNLKHATVRQRVRRGRDMLIFLLKERGIK